MRKIDSCLVCGGDLKVFLDLGEMPLVNNLKSSPEEKDTLYLLKVMECSCTHKQLSVAVDRELLFKDYLYQTGVSEQHFSFFLDFVFEHSHFKNVLDIGCNDGTLLEEFHNLGAKCTGVEPSKIEVENKDIKVIRDFFPTDKVKGQFDCITAFNVFAHNDNPKLFLEEMEKLLHPEGRIYILTTPARFDNYYHEHISYFTPQSMMVLASKCGLDVISFNIASMHGGSYLFEIAQKKKSLVHPDDVKSHEFFIKKGLEDYKNVVAYGASASETVMFNLYKIKPEYVVDDNPLKHGKFIPGINSPIVSPQIIKEDERDLTIICAHNLFQEISAKIKKLRPKHKDKLVRLI